MEQKQTTILLVDDDAMIRRMAGMMLERKGYAILEAAGGEEARDLMAADPSAVDLVILDLTMPGLSGKDTLLALRNIRPDLKIIISSGYEYDDDDGEDAEKPDGFLRKPFAMADLYAAVEQLI